MASATVYVVQESRGGIPGQPVLYLRADRAYNAVVRAMVDGAFLGYCDHDVRHANPDEPIPHADREWSDHEVRAWSTWLTARDVDDLQGRLTS